MNGASGIATRGKVLVVDDHRAARESVLEVLRHAGYEVSGAASAVEALGRLDSGRWDVLVTDLQMPGMDGIDLIRQVTRRRLPTQILMITAHASIGSAVEAMRQGAFDYLEKPFDAARLEESVARALARRQASHAGPPPASAQTGDDRLSPADDLGMIGESPAMRQLRSRIRHAAPTDETILICGESGVGKELVARAVHRLSRRAAGPLVSLNCPALSPQLAESELFGHRRGAFTGADADRIGRFEAASGGALFLDEVTEIDLPLQAKLLRVLQERTFEPVGSSETRPADVRIIASTNRTLQEEIAAGRFREDLYFRLAVLPLEAPPLRARGDDVQLLADFFLDRAAARLGRPRCRLTDGARNLLAQYDWPGNVRELENLVTRACVLSTGEVLDADALQPWVQGRGPEGLPPLPSSRAGSPRGESAMVSPSGAANLDELERETILATLDRVGGNRARAAAELGIGVRTLCNRLRSYGFAPRTRQFGEAVRQILPEPAAPSAGSSRRVA